MNARNKLNIAYINGSLLVAGLLGLIFQSALVFGLAVVWLVIANLITGCIRPNRKR